MSKQVMQMALDALGTARSTAMHNTIAARVPECGDFGAIAQTIDYVMGELRAAIAAPEVEPIGCVAKDGFTILYFQVNALPFETDLYTAPPDTEALRKELDDALKDRVALAMELERVKGEKDAMRQHLILVKDCLMQANEQVNGPICDTIWYSESETLFDYIDAAIAAQGGKV